jgi:hypothetical protein
MPHGLAMAADRPNFLCRDAGMLENFKRRIPEALANLAIERTNVVERLVHGRGWSTGVATALSKAYRKVSGYGRSCVATILIPVSSKEATTASIPSMLVPDIRPM